METDSKHEVKHSAEAEQSAGWTRLYITVVVALVVQIAFYVWLTKTFA